MQVTPPPGLARRRLIAASCALLGASAAKAQDTGENSVGGPDRPWIFDTSLAYYHENDGRLMTVEPVIAVRHDFGDERILDVSLAFNGMSGGEANGALPSRQPQTFVGPSAVALKAPNGSPLTYTNSSGHSVAALYTYSPFTVAPGAEPIDPTLHARTIVIGAGYQRPIWEAYRFSYGGSFDDGGDLRGVAGHVGLARDFLQKNTTVSLDLNGALEQIRPGGGGTPIPDSDYFLYQKTGHKSKHDIGAVLGVGQVISRRWLAHLDIGYDRQQGYLTDPYEIISVVNPSGVATDYRYEQRPEERGSKSVVLDNRYAFDRSTLDVSLHHVSDDWGLKSNAADIRFRYWNGLHDRYLEPRFRWYKQTAADFYMPYVLSTAPLPTGDASADPRIGPLHSLTFGVKYGAKLTDGSEVSLRLEEYRQISDEREAGPGALQGLDLYPSTTAVYLQLDWRFSY